MYQHRDRKEDANASLEPSKVGENETKEEGDEEVFEDSVSNTTTDDPSDTGDQVFTSFSIEEWDIVPRQPVDLKKEVEVRIGNV